MSTVELHEMDCRLAMSMLMDAESVDSIVTDPPYGLSKEPNMAEVLRHWLDGDDYVHKSAGFMMKDWDSFVPGPSVWREAYRVLKPGGHLVAFFGTRTYDLGVLAIRLAGFEIRDQTAWMFGSGFPKSHDVSKGIDRAAGAERAVTGKGSSVRTSLMGGLAGTSGKLGHVERDEPATPEAARWQGWGTALKPAMEPIVIARKPLGGRTVAANVLAYGTGAINIDACRVAGVKPQVTQGINTNATSFNVAKTRQLSGDPNEGRWPANVVHDGSPEVVALFPDSKSGARAAGTYGILGGDVYRDAATGPMPAIPASEGSAARFFQSCPYDESDECPPFYHPKASKADRNYGLDDAPEQASAASQFRPNHAEGAANGEPGNPYGRWSPVRNFHATVKPSALMQHLVRLVTPPGGTVLDPFMGSGTTGVACAREGFSFIGCEMMPEYMEIAQARIAYAYAKREA